MHELIILNTEKNKQRTMQRICIKYTHNIMYLERNFAANILVDPVIYKEGKTITE